MIEITPQAQNYFKQLLEQQDESGSGLRISVVNPGTPRAGCDLQFCPAGDQQAPDVTVEFSAFNLFVDAAIAFPMILQDLLSRVEVNRDYQKSEVLQTLRILKNYGLLRDPQMELFRLPRRKRSGSSE